MNAIQIGRKRLSEIVWNIIDEKVDDVPWGTLEQIVEDQQTLRAQADYNTGSIALDDAGELYRVVKFFNPSVIAEVGTFIGVSTRTMREAMPSAKIYTCDVSNDIIVSGNDGALWQYEKTPSHEMFAELAEQEIKVDLVYLDGRLSPEDVEPINKTMHERTVFILDDFEGTEKGVANAMMLESPNRVLIYPRENSKTAISLPFTLLQVVPQETT